MAGGPAISFSIIYPSSVLAQHDSRRVKEEYDLVSLMAFHHTTTAGAKELTRAGIPFAWACAPIYVSKYFSKAVLARAKCAAEKAK